MSVEWVVFDYGEVISKRTRSMPELAAVLGASVTELEQAYWAARTDYDRDLTDLQYWRGVGAACGVDDVDEATAAKLTEIDVAGWLHTEPDTLDLLTDLTGNGLRLALLSNAPASFAAAARQQPWTLWFEHLLFSGELGVVKPYPEMWALLTERLGTTAQCCMFFDDKQVNVDGAHAAGLAASRWTGVRAARADLAAMNVLG